MVSGRKTKSCDDVEAAEVAKVVENGTVSTGSPAAAAAKRSADDDDHQLSVLLRKDDVAQVLLRLLCMAASVTAVSSMVTAKQVGTVYIYGFSLPVNAKWSFSDSLEYLVGVSAAVAAHSLLQLLISVSRLLRKSPVIPSRNHAWFGFAGDQAFAFALMSAGSAASGVSNLNRTGIRHTVLPNFCKPLHIFCDHVAISIACTFFSCLLLATSAVQNVIWLSKN